jgi:hypothetical protein
MFRPDAEGTGVTIEKNGVVIVLNEDELMDFLRALEYGFADRFDKPGKTFGTACLGSANFGRPRPRIVDQQYLEQMATNQAEAHRGPGD